MSIGACSGSMLTPYHVPNCLRNAILEPNHIVFPVADVVANLLAKNSVPLVESIEVHIVCVHVTSTMVIDDHRTACGTVRLTIAVRSDTLKPRRILGNIIDRGKVHALAAKCIQGGKVIQCQWIWSTIHHIEVDFWFSMG